VVVNGTKNPHRSAVAKDITDAIIKRRAAKGVSALYWSKEEQESRLTVAFEKWKTVQDVWSAAALSVCGQQVSSVIDSMMSRSMSINCATYKKDALLEPDKISHQMAVALKVRIRDGIQSRDHLRAVLKSFAPWGMTLFFAETFASHLHTILPHS
jgi:hypothetical protein